MNPEILQELKSTVQLNNALLINFNALKAQSNNTNAVSCFKAHPKISQNKQIFLHIEWRGERCHPTSEALLPTHHISNKNSYSTTTDRN